MPLLVHPWHAFIYLKPASLQRFSNNKILVVYYIPSLWLHAIKSVMKPGFKQAFYGMNHISK